MSSYFCSFEDVFAVHNMWSSQLKYIIVPGQPYVYPTHVFFISVWNSSVINDVTIIYRRLCQGYSMTSLLLTLYRQWAGIQTNDVFIVTRDNQFDRTRNYCSKLRDLDFSTFLFWNIVTVFKMFLKQICVFWQENRHLFFFSLSPTLFFLATVKSFSKGCWYRSYVMRWFYTTCLCFGSLAALLKLYPH